MGDISKSKKQNSTKMRTIEFIGVNEKQSRKKEKTLLRT
jgi:hypothetical protein